MWGRTASRGGGWWLLEVYFPCSRELCGVSAILRHFLPWPLKITHRKTGRPAVHQCSNAASGAKADDHTLAMVSHYGHLCTCVAHSGQHAEAASQLKLAEVTGLQQVCTSGSFSSHTQAQAVIVRHITKVSILELHFKRCFTDNHEWAVWSDSNYFDQKFSLTTSFKWITDWWMGFLFSEEKKGIQCVKLFP